MSFVAGIFFAFAAMLTWAMGDFLIQKTVRKTSNLQTLAYIGIFGAIGIFPFVFSSLKHLTWNGFLLLLLTGIITFIAAIFNFEALKQGKLSVIEVILEFELPVTIFLSIVFLQEKLSLTQFFIVILIFLAIILVATKSFDHLKAKLEKGVLIALTASVFMGGVNFLTGASAQTVDPLMAVWFPWVIITIFCIVAIAKREGLNTFYQNALDHKWLVLIMAAADTIAWIFFAYATRNQNISIITAITESYPAVALFLGVYLNRERVRWYQYLGAVLALGGSVLLSLTVG